MEFQKLYKVLIAAVGPTGRMREIGLSANEVDYLPLEQVHGRVAATLNLGWMGEPDYSPMSSWNEGVSRCLPTRRASCVAEY